MVFRPGWSEECNHEVFGACAHPHGHGHNYVLEVLVAGQPDVEMSFSVDLGELDELLQVEARERVDHRHLNHDIALFSEGGKIPTSRTC